MKAKQSRQDERKEETKEGMEGEERKKEELRLTGNERGEGCLELGKRAIKMRGKEKRVCKEKGGRERRGRSKECENKKENKQERKDKGK